MIKMMMIMMLKLQFCANEVNNKSDRKKIESAVLGHIISLILITHRLCLCIDLKY